MANADTIIHTCSQFRITIYSYLNVFGLGEESGIVGENLCRPRKNAQTWFEPRTFLMWGTSANHWLTMLHCVLWALRLAYKKLLIENKQTNKPFPCVCLWNILSVWCVENHSRSCVYFVSSWCFANWIHQLMKVPMLFVIAHSPFFKLKTEDGAHVLFLLIYDDCRYLINWIRKTCSCEWHH